MGSPGLVTNMTSTEASLASAPTAKHRAIASSTGKAVFESVLLTVASDPKQSVAIPFGNSKPVGDKGMFS